ncbi:probable inactive receptor kinase RLK902 [Salvia miltiorrhiza]|uniref:probable inactive receptor kinase RLK902 n=1 Tax=Salvia miltiorrhiza TaxID=226208 RepID=UPI0025ACD357|nr:probable inactive receptor kinase RLK902 [Salvia miltiorrhiza]
MLSRAFVKPRRVPDESRETSMLRSSSIFEHEDFLFGFMDDIPLVSCSKSGAEMTLRQVLRASVGVIGESRMGMTEKVVLLGGRISAVKRFKRVVIRRNEFGRRVQRVAVIGNASEYLVPLTAYLYAKRIKFVVSDYYPMGSLADLLSGAKEEGHTALEWKYRYRIIQCIAKAIAFIHSQTPPKERHLKLNVHGNIKTSNVMINVDFSARLSDYGFVQLADQVAVEDTGQAELAIYEQKLSQESDVYNFGIVLMEILGWPDESLGAKMGRVSEFCVEGGEDEKQRSNVLEIASRCRNCLAHARPTINDVVACLG